MRTIPQNPDGVANFLLFVAVVVGLVLMVASVTSSPQPTPSAQNFEMVTMR